MKKLIAMLSIFVAMLGLAALELWYSVKFMGNSVTLLDSVEISIIEAVDEDLSPSLPLAKTANEYWEGGKKKYMKIANHNTVRITDEKFVLMLSYIEANDKAEALAHLRALRSYIKDLRQESYPLLHNIL